MGGGGGVGTWIGICFNLINLTQISGLNTYVSQYSCPNAVAREKLLFQVQFVSGNGDKAEVFTDIYIRS